MPVDFATYSQGDGSLCGICGFTGTPDSATLETMTQSLRHRGPDDYGSFSDPQVSLGHRRLSIVDLQAGRQPFLSEDGTLAVVFNGEIYNHPELKIELEAAGRRYRTRSDTESILHAYQQFGTDCVGRLDGMFAFVLYDSRKKTLFGARDRFGKKPLYYTIFEEDGQPRFAFASELKSLIKHPSLSRRGIDRRSLVDYLLNDYVVGSRSIYEQISRLPAGHAFEFGLPGSPREGLRVCKYWDIDLAPMHPTSSLDEAADEILRLLAEAVKRRLMADVPLGAFLSGGIDSSAIVAMLARLLPPEQIQTFSIAFDEASFDESAYARQVAEHYGTTHRVKRFSADAMLECLGPVVEMLDEPFADPSALPVSLLCSFAREHVTVALGGDGGDELFAGYDPFRAVGPARCYRRLMPASLHRRAIAPIVAALPASTKNMSMQFKLARFLRGAMRPAEERPAVWMGPFDPQGLLAVAPGLRDVIQSRPAYELQRLAADKVRTAGGDDLDGVLDFFERFYLTDDILVKVDRASMMHSLEVRAPFLDTRLAEYVNRLPREYKIRFGSTKFILKHALAGKGRPEVVPRRIVRRAKKGFGIPVARWIRHDLYQSFRETLLEPPPGDLDVFDRDRIALLLERHQTGAQNNYKELWALFMLFHWAQAHG